MPAKLLWRVLLVLALLATIAGPELAAGAGSPTPTATASRVTATKTPTPEPAASAKTGTATPLPDAVVAGKTVNLRAGPDTAFARIVSLAQGTALAVTGQVNKCAWLKVKTAKGQEGWVATTSGGKPLVTLKKKCDLVPVAKAPTPPPKPTSPPATRAKPTPTSPPKAASPDSDPNLGCYLLENYLGVELTFTFTARDWNWREALKVGPMEKRIYCLGPGRYTYTIDAPPPWDVINGELTVQKGDRLRWPIQGQS